MWELLVRRPEESGWHFVCVTPHPELVSATVRELEAAGCEVCWKDLREQDCVGETT
jgi:hypothetical protein